MFKENLFPQDIQIFDLSRDTIESFENQLSQGVSTLCASQATTLDAAQFIERVLNPMKKAKHFITIDLNGITIAGQDSDIRKVDEQLKALNKELNIKYLVKPNFKYSNPCFRHVKKQDFDGETFYRIDLKTFNPAMDLHLINLFQNPKSLKALFGENQEYPIGKIVFDSTQHTDPQALLDFYESSKDIITPPCMFLLRGSRWKAMIWNPLSNNLYSTLKKIARDGFQKDPQDRISVTIQYSPEGVYDLTKEMRKLDQISTNFIMIGTASLLAIIGVTLMLPATALLLGAFLATWPLIPAAITAASFAALFLVLRVFIQKALPRKLFDSFLALSVVITGIFIGALFPALLPTMLMIALILQAGSVFKWAVWDETPTRNRTNPWKILISLVATIALSTLLFILQPAISLLTVVLFVLSFIAPLIFIIRFIVDSYTPDNHVSALSLSDTAQANPTPTSRLSYFLQYFKPAPASEADRLKGFEHIVNTSSSCNLLDLKSIPKDYDTPDLPFSSTFYKLAQVAELAISLEPSQSPTLYNLETHQGTIQTFLSSSEGLMAIGNFSKEECDVLDLFYRCDNFSKALNLNNKDSHENPHP